MRANSLAARLFLSAAGWTIAILIVTGIVLSSVYRNGVERSFDRRLNVYLRTLTADLSSSSDPSDKFPQSLSEPLFELPLSGWYWQVTRLGVETPDQRASRSLWGNALPRLDEIGVAIAPGGTRTAYVKGPEDQTLRMIDRTVDLGTDGRFIVAVAGDAAEIDEEISAFDFYLLGTFAVLTLVLLLTTLFQVRFGLKPIRRLSDSIAAIRDGKAERLEGRYPEEIAPLAREIDSLLEANREIVERARTHVGNLAHALKTPLSVIVNEVEGNPTDPVARKVREQADIMRDQVTRHLERARIAARLTVISAVTEVGPVVRALARTMEKIYVERGITVNCETPDGVRFRGETHDLEEMVGNLLDNACKWAEARVELVVFAPVVGPNGKLFARIVVDDDGPGLPVEARETIARRGQRLDESKPGSGLGLSIVSDLVALYGGELVFDTAPIGGLRAELHLPAA